MGTFLTENSMFYMVGSENIFIDGKLDDSRKIRTYYLNGRSYFVRISDWFTISLTKPDFTEQLYSVQTMDELSESLFDMYGMDCIFLCYWYYVEDLSNPEVYIHGEKVNYPISPSKEDI